MLRINDIMLISSSILMAATLAGLEGGAVSVGQAYMAIIIGGVLLIGSFLRSNLYEPPEK